MRANKLFHRLPIPAKVAILAVPAALSIYGFEEAQGTMKPVAPKVAPQEDLQAASQASESILETDPLKAPPLDDKGLSLEPALTSALGISFDPFEYDPRGRRDPFVQPIIDRPMVPGAMHGPLLPLQRFNLSELALVGIIWDVKKPKAMLKDPSGNTHIVGPYTKIGPRNGYIAVIREGEIVVVETAEQNEKLVSTAQVVKIAK